MSCAAVRRAAAIAAGLDAAPAVRTTAIDDGSQIDSALLGDLRRVENRVKIPTSLDETAALYGITIPPSVCGFRRQRAEVARELQVLQDAAVRAAQRPVVRTPSRFVATTPRQMASLQISEGWTKQQADGQQRFLSAIRTRGLNGDGTDLGGQRTFGNNVLFVRDDNATSLNPRAPGRTPSKFTANTPGEMAVLGVSLGFVDENQAPTPSQRYRNSIRTKGLAGEGVTSGSQRDFGNLCIPVTRFGDPSL